MAKEFTYEITEEIAVLSETARGWTKELNKVSYGGIAEHYLIGRDKLSAYRRY